MDSLVERAAPTPPAAPEAARSTIRQFSSLATALLAPTGLLLTIAAPPAWP